MEKTVNIKSQKATKFVIVGVVVTLFDFIVYSLVAYLLPHALLWIAGVLAGIFATALAYVLHKNITWRERKVEKYTILMFFIWNAAIVFLLRPILITAFTFTVGIYQFGFMVSSFIGLPFTYAFIEKTGIYCFMTAITMVVNFIGYEKLVFRNKSKD